MKYLPFTIAIVLTLTACKTDIADQVDNLPSSAYYTEPHRPQYHFSPPEKWMNDPNGMVYYEGEYHLFYQYYPDDIVWGPMHWAHAVTTDLLHWEHLPIGLYPDTLGYIFSGSAVVDWRNTSGFGKEGKPPLIAIFTHHNAEGEKAGKIDFQYQSLAYSNDKGRTWTKYVGNPVVPNPGIRDFRDPKVIWDEGSNQWVMVFAAWDHVKFYGSPNLKDWTHLSDFGRDWGGHGGVWECPDLFPITVEGSSEKKWVLLLSINPGGPNGGSATQYFVGKFDGKNFTLDSEFAKALGKVDAYVPKDVQVFAHFENGYGEWKTEGNAFGNAPSKGTLQNQPSIKGFEGSYLANSLANGDPSTGKLTSPDFKIERPFINFLIGGGNDKLRLAINLIVDGKPVRSASGSAREELNWTGWNVADLKGKTAYIEIVDSHTGGWGHISVDQIIFADEMATPAKDKAIWLDWGRDNYAGVTWSDVPKEDGRRIFLGWMSNWDYAQVVPTEVWRSAMTLPRELVLTNTGADLRILSKPVKELKANRGSHSTVQTTRTKGKMDLSPLVKFTPTQMEGILEFEGDLVIELSNGKGEIYRIGYDSVNDEFFSDRTRAGKSGFSNAFAAKVISAPRNSKNPTVSMHIFFDVASAELFADGGETVLTDIFFPTEDFSKGELVVNGKLLKADFYEMKKTW